MIYTQVSTSLLIFFLQYIPAIQSLCWQARGETARLLAIAKLRLSMALAK